MQEYETLKQLVNEVADDLAKAQGGNKAAGTRVRKQMQGKLTISGGLATYPWDGTTLEDLVRHADRLILESKRQGKNVICYGSGCALPPNDSGDAPAIPQ